MVKSFENYFLTRDWRLLIIEIVSLVLAVLSAVLLESKFFQLFFHNAFLATIFAIVLIFAVTFSAYVLADNLQAHPRHERKAGYKAVIVILVVCYVAVLTAMLGMSNYTMAVSKTSKDLSELDNALVGVDDLPKIVQARNALSIDVMRHDAEIDRLQDEIGKLSERENRTGLTYVTKKQEYEKLIRDEKKAKQSKQALFERKCSEEESRLSKHSESLVTAGREEGTIGAFLARNPSALPMLALIILFISRVSFSFQPVMQPKIQPQLQVEVDEHTEEESLTRRRTIRNSKTGLQVPISQVFNSVESNKPNSRDEAILWYVQRKIGPENGWNQRRIAQEFNDGKLTEVNNLIKLKKTELARFEEV